MAGSNVDSVRVVSRTRNQRFDTSATSCRPRSILYSWSTMLPLASMSSPPSTSIEKRSRSGYQRLLYCGHVLAVALNLHRVSNVQLLLLERVQLIAGRRLQHERVTDPQRLTVHLERALTVTGLDPEVSPIATSFSRGRTGM